MSKRAATAGKLRFFILDNMGDQDDPDLCMLGNFIKGIEMDSWRVAEGAPVGAILPKDARLYMDKENLGIQLSSLLGNTQQMLIVHKDVKDIIQKHCGDEKVEYLSFTLYDHRKRVYSRDYFIINPLGAFDCLDMGASDVQRETENPERIVEVLEPVLDRKKMKNAPPLFRIDEDPATYVLSFELAKEISEGDFSNLLVSELKFSDA
ncbi:hypothetical protein BHS09_01015 [Myxococcus xanthus]|uniref:Uncharacterized protein n=1 Tax=Myxococcus xanthus TaxID=34 RepID=A0AAE6FVD7_MYXXA|nr:hypothetical protein [Myxococcus xanthus]QDE65701.1 hypothetical protein BHS09_01015 [Myxococcus xanthus]QDE72974.1 hypothetical protein BHS08_01015 [Myxococcus xanthus]QDF01800.1 hypothetical protein BHS04_01015 [Myxococcus xanthus]